MADGEEFESLPDGVEYVDMYDGDRYIGRISREEYEDALMVREAIRPGLERGMRQGIDALNRMLDDG